MVDFTKRSRDIEQMDDQSIQDARLTSALDDLRGINRYLGGYATSISALKTLILDRDQPAPLTVLDIGCGGGDFIVELVRWADQHAPDKALKVIGIDSSPATVRWAEAYIERTLPRRLVNKINIKCGDAFDLSSLDAAVNVAHCSLFLHHLSNDQIVRLMREMNQVASVGIIINDLHRTPLAYYSIIALSQLFRSSEMVRHDGPLSVLRAFSKEELTRLTAAAGIEHCRITWRWAFRWLMSTVRSSDV